MRMSRFRLQGKQNILKGLTLDTEMSQRFAHDNQTAQYDNQTARHAPTTPHADAHHYAKTAHHAPTATTAITDRLSK
jgi:hypothetical protein